jgi:hypothetical protein
VHFPCPKQVSVNVITVFGIGPSGMSGDFPKIIILPVILCGCKPLAGGGGGRAYGWKVFEDEMLSTICGHNKKEVTWGWRKVYNDKVRNLFSLPNIVLSGCETWCHI